MDVLVTWAFTRNMFLSGWAGFRKSSSDLRFLASNRATEVLVYIQEKNIVPASKLVATSYGQFRPIADFDTPEGRSANRRVEMLITKDDAGAKKLEEYYNEMGAESAGSGEEAGTAASGTGAEGAAVTAAASMESQVEPVTQPTAQPSQQTAAQPVEQSAAQPAEQPAAQAAEQPTA